MKIQTNPGSIIAACNSTIKAIEDDRAARDIAFLANFRIGHTGFLWWRKQITRTTEQQKRLAAKFPASYPSAVFEEQRMNAMILRSIANHRRNDRIMEIDGEYLRAIALFLEPEDPARI